MANVGAPDSWEQQAEAGSEDTPQSTDMSAKFSTLNVNAVEFVPSFSFKTDKVEETEAPAKIIESTDEKIPLSNGMLLFLHIMGFWDDVPHLLRLWTYPFVTVQTSFLTPRHELSSFSICTIHPSAVIITWSDVFN